MDTFDQPAVRKGTACIKWDFQEADYGTTGLLPFSIADADYRTYQPIVDALKERIDSGVIGYTDLDEEYFSAVKGWCLRRHGWEIESSWIVPTGGIVPAMSTAIEVLTGPGAGIIVQPPVYDPFYSIIEANGRKVLCNDLLRTDDGYRMDLEGLEKLAKEGAAMLLLCSPHNPVCRVWTKEELRAVAEICRRYGVTVVSDAIHWDLILGERKHVTMGQFKELYGQLIVFYIIGAIPILTGLDISTIARLGNGVSLIYVLFPIFTGYLIYKKNPEAMRRSTFKIKPVPLFILTTVALIGYIIAAILNFGDISSAWQMMLIVSAVVIVYAFLRERHLKKK